MATTGHWHWLFGAHTPGIRVSRRLRASGTQPLVAPRVVLQVAAMILLFSATASGHETLHTPSHGYRGLLSFLGPAAAASAARVDRPLPVVRLAHGGQQVGVTRQNYPASDLGDECRSPTQLHE